MANLSLRQRIIQSLKIQGFSVNGHIQPMEFDKSSLKQIQDHSRKEQLKLNQKFIIDGYKTISSYLVNGAEIDPSKIELELKEVTEGSVEHIIYRWWNLVWWSVPYQKSYGRQMRYILWDKTHNAPFGLIGLQSPVLKIAVRDKHLEIPNEELDRWINKSLQAQRLGALPPYNLILGGKMVGLAVTSNEIRNAYKRKYNNTVTVMNGKTVDANLLFITTTSAFGRSSIYNRLKFKEELVAQSLGFTKGSGTFHIPQEIYTQIQKYLTKKGIDVSTTFGKGPSRKLKLLHIAFKYLKLSDYQFHNIQREFFLFPLVKNLKDVISKGRKPDYHNRELNELTNFWKTRWAIPRSERFDEFKQHNGKLFIDEIMEEVLNG